MSFIDGLDQKIREEFRKSAIASSWNFASHDTIAVFNQISFDRSLVEDGKDKWREMLSGCDNSITHDQLVDAGFWGVSLKEINSHRFSTPMLHLYREADSSYLDSAIFFEDKMYSFESAVEILSTSTGQWCLDHGNECVWLENTNDTALLRMINSG